MLFSSVSAGSLVQRYDLFSMPLSRNVVLNVEVIKFSSSLERDSHGDFFHEPILIDVPGTHHQ